MKVYEVITDRILAALDEGTIPWRKPWKCSANAWISSASLNPSSSRRERNSARLVSWQELSSYHG